MKKVLSNIFRFYYDGFRGMTVGKTLWALILFKLFIMFAVLKLFFFPNFLKTKGSTEQEKANYVINELSRRVQD
jgi:hypothetical protein